MLCKHLETTDEDWHLYVNTCHHALNTYIYIYPSTVYSVFELQYLHKPAGLAHIVYSPLQYLSRSLGNYMKIMKKSFDVIKKIILDRRNHDHSFQQTRQIRTLQ